VRPFNREGEPLAEARAVALDPDALQRERRSYDCSVISSPDPWIRGR
jgi:hypothetical protein